MGQIIMGPVTAKRRDGRAIQVQGQWFSDFKEVPANKGDEVSIEYEVVEKGGMQYANIKKLDIIGAKAGVTGFGSANARQAREEKALTMLVSYAKDFAMGMVEHAAKSNVAIDTNKIWKDANERVLESYNFFKESLKEQ